ncbi:SSXT protein [Ancylostoma duodenale]|uniref:SSXT protein n=1 Tax=Ancylostoma duodenale TaxID=51022 RepID=A0A0C2G9S1_9BILA|nr:SSXT protein [Ancylostoma duodenale]
MSLAFTPENTCQGVPNHRSTVQALLDENSSLVKTIRDYLSMGRTADALKYQQLLHRNLIHLAKAADQSLLSQQRANQTTMYIQDENAPKDKNVAQPTPAGSDTNPSSEAPTPAAVPVSAPSAATPQRPPPPTTQAIVPPPMRQMQPSVAPMPPTSQPQMGMPMGPPQGHDYPQQGMPPAPQGLPDGQINTG